MGAKGDRAEPGAVTRAALACLARGWSVVPLRPRAKRPLIPWLEHQQRRAQADEIEAWFRRWPDANLGVVTGWVSRLIVIDVDPQHEGEASLAQLTRVHGPVPVTVEAITGGGGRHLYFEHPGRPLHNRAGIEPGIDVRGDGGYIVAPPSLHPSGAPYRWAAGRSPEEIEPAPMPDWLLEEAGGSPAGSGHPLDHWRKLVREGVAEGSRNSAIASLAGHLLWHGVDSTLVVDLLLAWNAQRCRPPLPDDEAARVVESIVRTHRRQRLQ
jgi:hypothetical protein